MSEAILVVSALLAGIDLRVIAMLALALTYPVLGLAAVVAHVMRSGGGEPTRSAVFCHSVARELRAGETIRSALAGAAHVAGLGDVAEDLERGLPLSEVLPVLGAGMPEIDDELVVLVEGVASSGSRSAALFDELGDLALAQVEMSEEIRMATTPARASSLVLIGLPFAYLTYRFSDGDFSVLLSDPTHTVIAVAGLVLVLTGLAMGWLLVRWAL